MNNRINVGHMSFLWQGLMVIVLTCMAFGASARELVSISKDRISLGEGVELIFSSDAPITTAPNLSTINADFTVSGQQMRTQSMMVNGTVTQKYELIYNLFPKHTGRLQIPSLELNGQRLNPITVTVTQTPTAEPGAGPLIVLEAQVSKPTAYLGEPILYTVRLFDVSKVVDGEITAPTLDKASIQQVGQDVPFMAMYGDRRVQGIQRRYMIIPEEAGSFSIEPSLFSGVVAAKPAQNLSAGDLFDLGILFDGMMGSEHIVVHAKPVDIKVLAKPSDWKGWWLPSTDVTLSEEKVLPDTATVGETLERVIRLRAKGVSGDALPLIQQPDNMMIKVYSSPAQRDTQMEGDELIGTLTASIVIVPLSNGDVEVPAVSIPWFNTATGEIERAVLPSQTIRVTGKGVPVAQVTPPVLPKAPDVPVVQEETDPELPIVAAAKTVQEPADPYLVRAMMWAYLAIGLFSGILVTAGIVFFIMRRRAKKKPVPDLYPF